MWTDQPLGDSGELVQKNQGKRSVENSDRISTPTWTSSRIVTDHFIGISFILSF